MTKKQMQRRIVRLERRVAELENLLDAMRGPCDVNISASSVDLGEIIQLVAQNNPRAIGDRPPDTPVQ